MAQIFPEWTNRLPKYIAAGIVITGVLVVGLVWYYFSPEYTDVGYRPKQPVPYSHKLHAGDLGIDCRYCHTTVEVSAVANVPPTQTCMNCHTNILPESETLLPIRESYAQKKPMQWVRVHNLPDYAYFDHSRHINSGIGCVSCHGNVAQMEIVMQVEPLSMSWCLDCHRNPDDHIRPPGEIATMNWQPPSDHKEFVARFKKEKNISPPTDCSGCHR